MASIAPAAPSRCPVADLVGRHREPARGIAEHALHGLELEVVAPIGVEVPCALTYCTSDGARPPLRNAACIAR